MPFAFADEQLDDSALTVVLLNEEVLNYNRLVHPNDLCLDSCNRSFLAYA